MKKLFSLLLLCMITVVAFAQKPVAGDMGLTMGINGLDVLGVTTNFGNGSTLLYRYYLTDNLALRARLNLSMSRTKSETSDTSGNSETDISKDHSWSVGIGIQKNCGGTSLKHIEPYIAPEIWVGSGKSGIMDNTSVFKNTTSHVVVDPGNSFGFGIIVNAGFNYYFTDHLALGAEFGYGLSLSSTAVGTTTTTTTVDTNPPVVDVQKTAKQSSFNVSGTGGTGLLMFTVAFGK